VRVIKRGSCSRGIAVVFFRRCEIVQRQRMFLAHDQKITLLDQHRAVVGRIPPLADLRKWRAFHTRVVSLATLQLAVCEEASEATGKLKLGIKIGADDGVLRDGRRGRDDKREGWVKMVRPVHIGVRRIEGV
jgi:hypothetical protein